LRGAAQNNLRESLIEEVRLSDVNVRRKKGASLLSRKRVTIFILREEVSIDISFFVSRDVFRKDPLTWSSRCRKE